MAATTIQRELTSEVRKRVGIPYRKAKPFPWVVVGFVVFVASSTFLFAKLYWLAGIAPVLGFGLAPILWSLDARDAKSKEQLFLTGKEAIGRVLEVEPSGASRQDYVVHVEYFVDEHAVTSRIPASPLARRGLKPGDDVLLVYNPAIPGSSLLLEKVVRPKGSENNVDRSKDDRAIKSRSTAQEVPQAAKGGCCGGGCGPRGPTSLDLDEDYIAAKQVAAELKGIHHQKKANPPCDGKGCGGGECGKACGSGACGGC